MKKAILPIFVLVMLLALVGSASASRPEPATFSITGYTTFYEEEPLPSGLTKFHIIARGGAGFDDDALCLSWYGASCQFLCWGLFGQPCGADGHFEGDFTFEEWVIADTREEGSGQGTNHGIMTITAANGSEVLIRFGGQCDSATVAGNFTVLGGTGDYAGHGRGTYAGNAGALFTVDFTGWFHTHP